MGLSARLHSRGGITVREVSGAPPVERAGAGPPATAAQVAGSTGLQRLDHCCGVKGLHRLTARPAVDPQRPGQAPAKSRLGTR